MASSSVDPSENDNDTPNEQGELAKANEVLNSPRIITRQCKLLSPETSLTQQNHTRKPRLKTADMYGNIPGVVHGQIFSSRAELYQSKVHKSTSNVYCLLNGCITSLLLNGQFPVVDEGRQLYITWEESNNDCKPLYAAFRDNWSLKCPIRVIRSYLDTHNGLGPQNGYRYDGLYKVLLDTAHVTKTNVKKSVVLRRLKNQPETPYLVSSRNAIDNFVNIYREHMKRNIESKSDTKSIIKVENKEEVMKMQREAIKIEKEEEIRIKPEEDLAIQIKPENENGNSIKEEVSADVSNPDENREQAYNDDSDTGVDDSGDSSSERINDNLNMETESDFKENSKCQVPVKLSSDHREISESQDPFKLPSDDREISESQDPFKLPSDDREISEYQDPFKLPSDDREISESQDPFKLPSDDREISESQDPFKLPSDDREISECQDPLKLSSDEEEVEKSVEVSPAKHNCIYDIKIGDLLKMGRYKVTKDCPCKNESLQNQLSSILNNVIQNYFSLIPPTIESLRIDDIHLFTDRPGTSAENNSEDSQPTRRGMRHPIERDIFVKPSHSPRKRKKPQNRGVPDEDEDFRGFPRVVSFRTYKSQVLRKLKRINKIIYS